MALDLGAFGTWGCPPDQGAKVPGNEIARERKGPGAKAPGSDLARERIDQGPIGRFAPGNRIGPGAKRLGTVKIDVLTRDRHLPLEFRF